MKGIVIGRVNIPHRGHVHLLSEALRMCDRVDVCLSTSKSNSKAADWHLRVQAFRLLLNDSQLKRVSFTSWNTIHDLKGYESDTAFVGYDNHDLVSVLVKCNIVKQAILVNKLVTKENNEYSSTRIRYVLDNNIIIKNNTSYYQVISQIRKQEIERNYDS